MTTLISKEVMLDAIHLSAEWNNTGFVIINESGVPEATIWQHFKYMDPKPKTIAYVNGNDGFVLQDKAYIFEIDPKELL